MIVMCIDDDAEDTSIFVECISKIDASINCIVANNGASAIKLLSQGSLPNIIFVDVNMPVMNGKDVLSAIKTDYRLKNIPVVMYSGNFSLHQKNNLTALGAREFLEKNSDLRYLESAIRKCLDRYR
jgi:CheY-like chemotaxis protein